MENTDKKEPLYYDGRHYDAQQKNYSIDIPFYLEQCVKYGDPVLELACGTGRVTIPIAKAGFDITGVDISSNMLNSAAVDAAKVGANVKFIKGDIRHLNLDRKFAVIIFPFNAICHLLDLKSIISTFIGVKKFLSSNGKFIFDVMNPDFYYFTRPQNVEYPVAEYPDPDSDEKIILTENNYYDRATQINHVMWHYKIGEKHLDEELPMRMFYPQELQSLMMLNGFKIEHRYGDFDCKDFTSEAKRQILVCSARG